MNDDDDHHRWRTFISALPSEWLPVATAFSKACGVVEGNIEEDGSWTLDLTFGLSELRQLLRDAPVEFTAVDVDQVWVLQQHVEVEAGIHVAREARAVLSWHDHFAAGLGVSLSVYATDERYDAALAAARDTHAETYSDDQDEGDPDDEQSPW
jgi:hypothetical protein